MLSSLALLRAALTLLLAVAFIGGWLPSRARAEYALAPGDVLEIVVTGFPELRQQLTIDTDGVVSLSGAGAVRIAGSTLGDAAEKVRRGYTSGPMRLRGADGRQGIVQIYPEEVVVRVAEYRPIYILGDVARPGAQAFRGQLTVERAIALAGGLDLSVSKARDTVLQRADVEAEREILKGELTAALATIRQIRLGLGRSGGSHDLYRPDHPDGARGQNDIDSVISERFGARQHEFENETRFLARQLEQVRTQVASVERHLQQAKDLYNAQSTLTDGLRRSAATSKLVVIQNQRELEAMLGRIGQVETQLAQARSTEEDVTRRIGKVRGEYEATLLRELQEATSKLKTIEARQTAVSEKLAHLGPSSGPSETDAVISIQRDGATGSIVANAQTSLQPGDVIRVTLRPDEGRRSLRGRTS